MAIKVTWLDGKSTPYAQQLPLPDGLEVRFLAPAEAEEQRDWPEVLVAGNPNAALLDGSQLKRVVVPWAGIASGLREGAAARPQLRVHNSHYNGAMVAQHALALLLACSNRIVSADRAMRRGDWGSDVDEAHLGVQLSGKVALLLGYGSIGTALEPLLEALGMEVRAYRRRKEPGAGIRQYGEGELTAALKEADAVLVSLPNTPATTGLLGAAELALLKPSAVIVNVGRGPVIDERALYEALAEGRLLGAGIDVWYQYPQDGVRTGVFPSAYPFQELSNVVMSPHRGNDVREWPLAAAKDVLQTLAAFTRGEERNLVDVASGY